MWSISVSPNWVLSHFSYSWHSVVFEDPLLEFPAPEFRHLDVVLFLVQYQLLPVILFYYFLIVFWLWHNIRIWIVWHMDLSLIYLPFAWLTLSPFLVWLPFSCLDEDAKLLKGGMALGKCYYMIICWFFFFVGRGGRTLCLWEKLICSLIISHVFVHSVHSLVSLRDFKRINYILVA